MSVSSGLLSPVLDRPSLAPARKAVERGRSAPPPAHAATCAQPAILVVDDNTWLLEQLGRLLAAERYLCALAQDGQRAWSWLDSQRPALVILNWHLRGASAAGVISAIRNRHGATVPILAIATLADAEAVQYAGADAFLRRPYFTKDLVGMAYALLDC